MPLMLALWTGQRQRDLMNLQWSQYDGTNLRFKQQKTNARVLIPVGAGLRAALDMMKAEAERKWGNAHTDRKVLLNLRGAPWTQDGFRASWNKACQVAGIVGKTFHDLRGTAVTRLARAGSTEAEIVAITGHSIREASMILQKHYLKLDHHLATAAIRKLEAASSAPNQAPN